MNVRKSLKLIRILLLIGLALVLVMSVAARVEPRGQTIPINNINFNVTVVDLKTLKNGNLVLKLVVTGSGIIDCGTNQGCSDAGLNGKTVSIQQGFNLNMVLDVIENPAFGVIRGQTAGQLQIGLPGGNASPFNFKGAVEGSFIVDSTHVDLQLLVKAGGKLGRKLNMDLSGVYNKLSGKFENLGGEGRLLGSVPDYSV
jgi:hypothetical protein